MSISRRIFLRHTAAAGAATVVAPAAAQAVAPEMTAHERAIWHMEELERLVLADGASEATIIVCGHSYGGIAGVDHGKAMALHPGKRLVDRDGMFAAEGGAAWKR
jgi:anaerobic selenocysteine-containing dehydrogenase